MFQLDGQWIAGYIGVIGGLMAFVVGVSALIFQVALPSYLRMLTRRHFFRETTYLMGIYLLAVIVLIWVAPISRSDEIPWYLSVPVDFVMTVLLITTIWYSLKHLLHINGDAIIESLVKECQSDYDTFGKFRGSLETLIDIGAQSSAGFEKKRVIDALSTLIEYVLRRYTANVDVHHLYDGTKFITLVGGFEDVLMGDIPGSQDNYKAAAAILGSLIKALCEENRYVLKTDLGEALGTCSVLGIDSTARFTDAVTEKFIMAINKAETADRLTYGAGARALRKIGTAALKAEKFEMASRAIQEQIGWDEDPFSPNDEGTKEMLGLWAHVYTSSMGGAAHIRSQIDKESDRFFYFDEKMQREVTLDDCLVATIAYHALQSHFDTHDKLLIMREEFLVTEKT